MQLELDVHTDGPVTVVSARGEIDLATIGEFREVINGLIVDGGIRLVVDLDEVTFMDSTGLGVLIGARRRVHAFKGSFGIVCNSVGPVRVFDVTGLDKVFTFYPSRAEALRVLAVAN